jgi:hypothetical protein
VLLLVASFLDIRIEYERLLLSFHIAYLTRSYGFQNAMIIFPSVMLVDKLHSPTFQRLVPFL